jgi:hypothetical protein
VLSLHYQDKLLRNFKSAQDLLDKTSYYQLLYGDASQAEQISDFWKILRFLSFIRASIPNELPPYINKKEVLDFATALDQYTVEYFRMRATRKHATMVPVEYRSVKYDHVFLSAAMLQRNPELLKGWVTMFITSSAKNVKGESDNQGLFLPFFTQGRSSSSRWYGQMQLLTDELAQRMDDYKGKHRELREAELEFFRAKDDSHSSAARAYTRRVSNQISRRDYYGFSSWLDKYKLERFGTSALMLKDANDSPHHFESILASLVQEPIGSQEVFFRSYRRPIMLLMGLEEGSASEVKRILIRQNYHVTSYNQYAKEASKVGGTQAALDRLGGGIRLWERIYGRPLYDRIFKDWKNLYPMNKKTIKDAGLGARLLVDLRSIDKSMPGLFKLPTIDKVQQSRIWLHYQPYEKKPFVDGSSSSVHRRQPWLVSVDCNTGELSTLVNLAKTPGLDPGASLKNDFGSFHGDKGFIAQTDKMILTDASWGGSYRTKAVTPRLLALFSKENGKFVALDPPTVITNRLAWSPTVAIGEDFFCIQRAGDLRAFYRTSNDIPFHIVRVNSAGKVSPVTVSGRRPELTPFDPADRGPKNIFPHGGRLLVIHSSDHTGHFNPKNGSWEMAKVNERRLTNKDFRSHIFPHHKIGKTGKIPALIIDSQTTYQDRLSIIKGSSNHLIKVQLEIPDDFLNQSVFADHKLSNGTTGKVTGKWWTYAERIGSDTYHLVVLNQTKDDLILGLKMKPGMEWKPGKRTGIFLPLIWALPKENLSAEWMTQVEATKASK